MTRFDPELIKGTTELIVLAVLKCQSLHGYAIIKRLRERSGDRFRMNEGALYPLLHRLVRQGKLKVRTDETAARARKVYRLTATGRKALAVAMTLWHDYAAFMTKVINDTTSEEERER